MLCAVHKLFTQTYANIYLIVSSFARFFPQIFCSFFSLFVFALCFLFFPLNRFYLRLFFIAIACVYIWMKAPMLPRQIFKNERTSKTGEHCTVCACAPKTFDWKDQSSWTCPEHCRNRCSGGGWDHIFFFWQYLNPNCTAKNMNLKYIYFCAKSSIFLLICFTCVI